jgi:CheY-specific phosphatase CheX
MPDTDFDRALRDSVREVLEKMFFVQPLDAPFQDTETAGGDVAVKLTFDGSPSGALTLCVSHSAARQIAADFLGADQADLSSSQIHEVVCELANMICGSVLSRVESTATFRLSKPEVFTAEERRYRRQAADRRAIHSVRIDSGTLTATVETRETACPVAEKSAS